MSTALQQLRMLGWRRWLFFTLRLDEIGAWFERVYYCHHNARVISDFEWRMACVLTECTRGMSKPYYTIEAMRAEISDYQQQLYKDGYDEGYADAKAEFEDTE
jgi:hypothetical protein